MINEDLAMRSLRGLWVGDCIGNVGQLYFAHDILKALDDGIVKFSGDNINFMAQHFQYSDDTDESIILLSHIIKYGEIRQNKLAIEFANRFMYHGDNGEIMGYGLTTRKVLTDIYNGIDWRVANKTKPRIESPSFVDTLIANVAGGNSLKDSMTIVKNDIEKHKEDKNNFQIGSCGNGSAMRVAPLGACLFNQPLHWVADQAKLQAEVTHCHPEGIAGSIAVTILAAEITLSYDFLSKNRRGAISTPKYYYDMVLKFTPKGHVWDGIKRASELPLDTPIGKLQEILGNGTHVTCQDTIPLCVFLTIKAINTYKFDEMYEKVIIETCKCFGDVDTNCAIVGGMIGIISPPPEKWIRYCQPIEGLMGEPLPENKRKPIQNKLGFNINKDVVRDILRNTEYIEGNLGIGNSTEKDWKPLVDSPSEAIEKNPPSFSEMIVKRFPGKTYRL